MNVSEYRAQGITTIPMNLEDKKPKLKRWTSAKLDYRWEEKYPDAGIGMLTGDVVTVIDVDVDKQEEDERARYRKVEEDAEWARHFFGETPIEVRTPRGGYHFWYRGNGEKMGTDIIAGDDDYQVWGSIDIRGKGACAIVPDTPGYRFVRGYLEDVPCLPDLPAFERKRRSQTLSSPIPTADTSKIRKGTRNDTLFRRALAIARTAPSLDWLIDALNTINWSEAEEPLPDAEVKRIAESVWRMKEEGRLFVPGEPSFVIERAVKDALRQKPHAFLLYSDLVDLHGWRQGEPFILANAAAKERYGLDIRRFQRTISELVDAGLLEVVNPGGRVWDREAKRYRGIPRQVRLI